MWNLSENCSHLDCANTSTIGPPSSTTENWLESETISGFRVWQLISVCIAGFLTLVIALCCCIRFRIPRTKQEIEADYIRKKITRKFEKQLRMIHNADMDEMDLKRALDRIRAEFKSDTESLAQSEALSAASLSSGIYQHGTYRKASDIGITFDELLHKHENTGKNKLPSITTMFSMLRRPKKVFEVVD